jgi:hypothetical protein
MPDEMVVVVKVPAETAPLELTLNCAFPKKGKRMIAVKENRVLNLLNVCLFVFIVFIF